MVNIEAEPVGLRSRLRARFRTVADEVGAANQRVVVAVPVKQLVEAVLDELPQLADVPDYDPELAEKRRWVAIPQAVDDADPELDDLDVIPPDVAVLAVGGEVVVRVGTPSGITDIPLAALDARDFFLSGLAAAEHARRSGKG